MKKSWVVLFICGGSAAAAPCPGWVVPVRDGGAGARFEIARSAAKGVYDQDDGGECVTQGDRSRVVPHGARVAFDVPASTTALTDLRFGRHRFLVSIPEGETLTLASNPCSRFRLDGRWLDKREHSQAATPSAGGAPSEVVFLRGQCTAERAEQVKAVCADKKADCVMPARAGYCSPVSVQGKRHTADLYLGYGDRFAVCLDADDEVTATLRLPTP